MLPGKPVRGGGRAVSTYPGEGSVGMELERLRALPAALRRRVLRGAAKQLGFALNFEQTERLMAMCEPEGGRKQEVSSGLTAERSARELRLLLKSRAAGDTATVPVEVTIPGEASGFGVRLQIGLTAGTIADGVEAATLRSPKAGDRVRIRHSRAAKPLKELFERMQIETEARKSWPVLEWQGRIVWMKGIDIDPEPDVPFTVEVVPGA
jgi:tRNA(Ile)-lysidine synthase